MISHKYISNFIRQRFTAPTEACEIRSQWLTGLSNGWQENWPEKYRKALIIDLVAHLHAQPSGVRPDTWRKPQTDTINFRSISPHCQWPLTAYSSLLRGLGLLRKAQHDSLPHLCVPPSVLSSAFLHMSASSDTYVAFRVCQWGCFFFNMSAMDERFSYLFIAFCCSLSLYPFLYHLPSQINFCHSQRKGR